MTTEITAGSGHSVIVEDGNFKLAEIKAERNLLLAQSDCYILEDFPTSKTTEWKTYRTSLRDMDFSDLDNLSWPTKPE